MSLRWHVVNTRSGSEWEVHHGLLARGIEDYVPHILEFPRYGRFRRATAKPMFPGYTFAGVTIGQEVERIESTPHVICVLRNGREPIIVAELEMLKLRVQGAEAYRDSLGQRAVIPQWKVGDWCPFPSGPLMGMPAQIDSIDKSGLVRVSLGNIAGTFHLDDLRGSCVQPVRQSA